MSSNDQVIGNDYELVEQADFYQKYLPLIEPNLTADDVRVRSTDGLIGDLLLEFKPSITDLNAVLFQALRYLSKFRISDMEQNFCRGTDLLCSQTGGPHEEKPFSHRCLEH